MSIRTSSGVTFGKVEPEAKIKNPGKRNLSLKDISKSLFNEECQSYGLGAWFFNHAALSNRGELCYLEGFNGDNAVFITEIGTRREIPFSDGVREMKNAIEKELSDLSEKALLLSAGDSSVSETRKKLESELAELTNSLSIYNGHMFNVCTQMGLEDWPVALTHENKLCEFISCREGENGYEYILENLDADLNDLDSRYIRVSFESLEKDYVASGYEGHIFPYSGMKELEREEPAVQVSAQMTFF